MYYVPHTGSGRCLPACSRIGFDYRGTLPLYCTATVLTVILPFCYYLLLRFNTPHRHCRSPTAACRLPPAVFFSLPYSACKTPALPLPCRHRRLPVRKRPARVAFWPGRTLLRLRFAVYRTCLFLLLFSSLAFRFHALCRYWTTIRRTMCLRFHATCHTNVVFRHLPFCSSCFSPFPQLPLLVSAVPHLPYHYYYYNIFFLYRSGHEPLYT